MLRIPLLLAFACVGVLAQEPTTYMVPMADGTKLATTIALPEGDGPPLAEYDERVNLYDAGDLYELLAGAGFRVHHDWGEYDGGAFDPHESSRHLLLSLKES